MQYFTSPADAIVVSTSDKRQKQRCSKEDIQIQKESVAGQYKCRSKVGHVSFARNTIKGIRSSARFTNKTRTCSIITFSDEGGSAIVQGKHFLPALGGAVEVELLSPLSSHLLFVEGKHAGRMTNHVEDELEPDSVFLSLPFSSLLFPSLVTRAHCTVRESLAASKCGSGRYLPLPLSFQSLFHHRYKIVMTGWEIPHPLTLAVDGLDPLYTL
eukprot:748790-Hanusia_phi.AAC.2